MKRITLPLKNSTGNIVVGQDIMPLLGKELVKIGIAGRVVVISDKTVAKIYGAVVKHSLRAAGFKSDIIAISPGEKTKTLETAKKLYEQLILLKVHRDTTIVALGGGVVGDIAGFVSATYMRGVRFVQVPTSLLAQVDASIGGKTAVNLDMAKNIVGVFYQPKLVFCDVSALITLPSCEIRSGLAEVIKYGVIKDAALFSFLEKQLVDIKNPALTNQKEFKKLLSVWEKIVYSSAAIKAQVVTKDETETKGPRMLLNLGHTIGHALESLKDYKGISHGQAVAAGMVAAAMISRNMKLCNETTVKRITSLILATGLLTHLNGFESEDIIAKLILDKKVRDGKVLFVLPKTVGTASINNIVPVKILRRSLKQAGAK